MKKFTNYTEFKDSTAAEEWLKKYEDSFPNINNAEIEFLKAMNLYTGLSAPINSALVNPDKSDIVPELSEKAKLLSSGLRDYCIPENIVLYRFAHKHRIKRILNSNNIMTFDSIISTTLLPNEMHQFAKSHYCDALLKIYVPAGTPGTYTYLSQFVDPDCPRLQEYEFIFPKGTSAKILKCEPPDSIINRILHPIRSLNTTFLQLIECVIV